MGGEGLAGVGHAGVEIAYRPLCAAIIYEADRMAGAFFEPSLRAEVSYLLIKPEGGVEGAAGKKCRRAFCHGSSSV